MDQQSKDAEQEAKLARLRAALQEGLDSGPAEEFDIDAFIAEVNAEYEATLARSPRRKPGPRSNPER